MSNINYNKDQPIVVIKFGSSVLTSKEDIYKAVSEIYRHYRKGQRCLVVVSAIGDKTSQLIKSAELVHGDEHSSPDAHAYASLLATGEEASCALLVIALCRAGILAKGLGGHGVITSSDGLHADPISLDTDRINRAFSKHAVVVIPGFFASNAEGDRTLLGRGGSDLTALFCAHQLGAQKCLLIKDVDGIYNRDPNIQNNGARSYRILSFSDALKIKAQVVQDKALAYASDNNLSFYVRGLHSCEGTLVGLGKSSLRLEPDRKTKPLKIVLLGLGTVGYGIYQRILAQPDLFEISGVLVKSKEKHRVKGIDSRLISDNHHDVLHREADIVIELIGSIHPALSYVRKALERGSHVITANKALISEYGDELHQIAEKNRVNLFYSAAVAGAVPVLECLNNLGQGNIEQISGVLNGTTNYIIGQLSQGVDFKTAVIQAKSCGFAEADPTLDLNGHDAAQKLVIASGLAFGVAPDETSIEGICQLTPDKIQGLAADHKTVRLVASSSKKEGRLTLHVAPVVISNNHPFADVHNENNRVLIRTCSGREVCIEGKGAGRWPTAEAVFADLIDIVINQEKNLATTQYGEIKQ